ncbi:MAG: hypothetical protein K2V38_08130, partial [Gemmataceae bacterium]|nr:hypothetical protein [Gemmataceae bacterium]
MTAAPEQTRPFAALWGATADALAPLGLTDRPPDPEFRARHTRMTLTAARWLVGPADRPVAECRIVRILGAAAEIVNAMIFPTDPAGLPVFASELLAFGGRPRLTFLDLQNPGLASALRGAIAERTRAISAAFPEVPRDPDPPGWAVAYSPGGYLFTRTDDLGHTPALCEAFRAYLGAWTELARDAAPAATPAGRDALAEYKRDHVAHSPGRAFLGKVFG